MAFIKITDKDKIRDVLDDYMLRLSEQRVIRAPRASVRASLRRWIKKHRDQEWSWATEGSETIIRRDK